MPLTDEEKAVCVQCCNMPDFGLARVAGMAALRVDADQHRARDRAERLDAENRRLREALRVISLMPDTSYTSEDIARDMQRMAKKALEE